MKNYRWKFVVLLSVCAPLMLSVKAFAATPAVPNLNCSVVGNGTDMLLWTETENGPGEMAVHPREGLGLIKWKLRLENGIVSRADPRDNRYSSDGRLVFERERWGKNLFRVEGLDQVTYLSANPTWSELVVMDVTASGVYFYSFVCTILK